MASQSEKAATVFHSVLLGVGDDGVAVRNCGACLKDLQARLEAYRRRKGVTSKQMGMTLRGGGVGETCDSDSAFMLLALAMSAAINDDEKPDSTWDAG